MQYHNAPTRQHKQYYRKLDHIAILFVIAGTYSPFIAGNP